MITAEYGLLAQDGITYHTKLKAAGNDVVYRGCPRMTSGFFNRGKYIDEGVAMWDWVAENISRIVGK